MISLVTHLQGYPKAQLAARMKGLYRYKSFSRFNGTEKSSARITHNLSTTAEEFK
jgi:hypothetical protein